MPKKTSKKTNSPDKISHPMAVEVEPTLLFGGIIDTKFLAKLGKKIIHKRIFSRATYLCGILTSDIPLLFKLRIILKDDLPGSPYFTGFGESNTVDDEDNPSFTLIYEDIFDFDSILPFLPHMNLMVTSEYALFPLFTCEAKKRKKVWGGVECYVKPIIEGIFERTEEGYYWYQVLRLMSDDEEFPFYLRTVFQPDADHEETTHCAKKGHLEKSGVGHCSGKLIDLNFVKALVQGENLAKGIRLTGILGVTIL